MHMHRIQLQQLFPWPSRHRPLRSARFHSPIRIGSLDSSSRPDPRRDRRRGHLLGHSSVVVAGTCQGVAGLAGSAFAVAAGHTVRPEDHIDHVAGRTGPAVGHNPGLAGMDWASLGNSRCLAPGYYSSLPHRAAGGCCRGMRVVRPVILSAFVYLDAQMFRRCVAQDGVEPAMR